LDSTAEPRVNPPNKSAHLVAGRNRLRRERGEGLLQHGLHCFDLRGRERRANLCTKRKKHLYIHIYIPYTCIYIYTCIYLHVYRCMHIYTYIYIYIYIYRFSPNLYTYIHICICLHTHTHIYIYIHTYVDIYIGLTRGRHGFDLRGRERRANL